MNAQRQSERVHMDRADPPNWYHVGVVPLPGWGGRGGRTVSRPSPSASSPTASIARTRPGRSGGWGSHTAHGSLLFRISSNIAWHWPAIQPAGGEARSRQQREAAPAPPGLRKRATWSHTTGSLFKVRVFVGRGTFRAKRYSPGAARPGPKSRGLTNEQREKRNPRWRLDGARIQSIAQLPASSASPTPSSPHLSRVALPCTLPSQGNTEFILPSLARPALCLGAVGTPRFRRYGGGSAGSVACAGGDAGEIKRAAIGEG